MLVWWEEYFLLVSEMMWWSGVIAAGGQHIDKDTSCCGSCVVLTVPVSSLGLDIWRCFGFTLLTNLPHILRRRTTSRRFCFSYSSVTSDWNRTADWLIVDWQTRTFLFEMRDRVVFTFHLSAEVTHCTWWLTHTLTHAAGNVLQRTHRISSVWVKSSFTSWTLSFPADTHQLPAATRKFVLRYYTVTTNNTQRQCQKIRCVWQRTFTEV